MFGPNNATCTGTPLGTSTVTVTGNGTYPSGPFTAAGAGTYNFVAVYSGDVNNSSVTSACGAPGEAVTVTKAPPTITTTASASVPAGGTISDSAVLAGGFNPTGTITFMVFGPNNATCTGTPLGTSTVTVTGNGTYPSGPFTSAGAGTYNFVAVLQRRREQRRLWRLLVVRRVRRSTVTKAPPTIATTASASVPAGGTISDSAVLAGGFSPTGTITFTVFGPNNATCTGTPLGTSTVAVAGNGTYPSGPFTAAGAGTYNFVAVYSGDANNASVASACGAASESVTVTKAAPTIVTTASASVPAGGTISDSAVLAGGFSPTGTITFTVFGPNNATCTGTPLGTSTVTVTGNGTYPSGPFTAAGAGTYNFVASYSGDSNNAAMTSACGAPGEAVTVTKAPPTITTTASPSVPAGGTISDSAVLGGGFNPTGTITFTVFGPNNATCTGTPLGTSTVTVTGNGTYPSGPFTAAGAGTYNFVAVYSGDANNASVTSACGAPGEAVTVTKAPPTITTTASASVPAGGTISDSAVLAGGFSPTGTITFTVFGPNNATCTGTPLGTSTVTATGDGTYPSGPFTTTGAGTYNFVAVYSGDANNASVTSACGAPGESVTVTRTPPTITTTASASVPAGGTISDSAVLAGGFSPTGTITFTVFGPNNATCSGTALGTSTVTVAGNGTYPSGPFTVASAGTYNFIAVYSGDANNAAVASACGAPGESVTVTPAVPSITTTASAPVAAGGTISDSAVLAGGSAPTGTITFTVFGPNNATCTGTPLGTSTVTVTGNGTYPSGPFTSGGAGTYNFVAVYSGDANNSSVTSACGAANEAVTVGKAPPTITTTASASVTAGGTISDSAVLAGGFSPTGTITFTVFGPNNATCTGTPLGTSTVTVTGNGTYPSGPFTAAGAGTYNFVAVYSGDANNAGVASACGAAGEAVTVTKAPPTITTTASPSVPAGGTISDSAVLSGGFSPTGTITFTVFGPNNAACTGTPLGTSTVTVTGNGTYPSGPFTAAGAGTYNFVAVYSGDANNAGVTSACGAANEAVTVTKAPPTITTTASASVPAGGTISDSAVLTGGSAPTGTITFTVFGPNNPTCTGTPLGTSTVTVAGSGTYPSGPFTTAGAGTYNFVAVYSGDANNAGATSACGAPNESVTVTPTPPTITTTASASVPAGGTISDSAVLTGGFSPTGTITFTVFGPNNATCAGTPLGTSTVTVTGNGTYPSGPFTSTGAGTYNFVAAYSGDVNNAAVTSACGAPGESVTVTKAPPTITTTASAAVAAGGTISDSAALAGGAAPTGTITFTVFGPNNATCTGTPLGTSTVTVTGNGTYLSGPFTATGAGTYNFVAVYSGDANNAGVTSACGAAGEAVTVTKAPPTITTTASASVPAGGTISDSAVLAGGFSPTGTITFTVFGPNNATCTGTPLGTSTVTVTGNGTYPSGPFTSTGAGTYNFVAVYSGDANNAGVTSACGTANESVTVTKAPPTITTTASASVPAGGTISDAAVLAGGAAPTGTITFTVFGPNDATCTGTPLGTAIVTVTGSGTYPSGPFTSLGAGTYNFVASYSGDANNAAAISSCGAANESVVVTKTAPGITTRASAPASGAISDTATLAGGTAPTGTITFSVFGPNNPTCTGVPLSTSTVTVAGAGAYASGPFRPTAPGTYLFVASYSGDASNAAATTACGDANESVTLPQPVIAVTKVASPLTEIAPGGTFTFTVRVSNPSAVDPITITSLTDDVYGNIATRVGSTCGALIGVTLAPGASSDPCSFTGPFTGTAGASQTDTVTVNGIDSNGFPAMAVAHATVSLVSGTPQIAVTKVASPLSRPEPGGSFTFTVQVSNPSTVVPVTITALTDNVYGNIATLAGSTCGALIGTTLQPGQSSPTCSFSGPFSGKAGASQTDTVTVTGVNNGVTVTATANATVTLTPASPQIAVTKVVSPLTLVAPGGTFKFTVQVSNPSTFQPVTITALVDNVYGNLATRAGSTCGTLIGVVLAPGATSPACTFTGPFTGVAGDTETDTVTVTGTSNGTTVTATARATVSLTPAPVIKPASVVSSSTLHRPAGCVGITAKIFVSGTNIKSVSYSLDGKHLVTVTAKDSSGHYTVTVKTAGLSSRQHRLVAVVTYRTGKTRTLHATIVRCQPPKLPLFTG